jgi:hypothetical protein
MPHDRSKTSVCVNFLQLEETGFRVQGSGFRVQGFDLNPRSTPHSAPDLSWPETDSCLQYKDVQVEQVGLPM